MSSLDHKNLPAVVHSISSINGYGAAWSLARAGIPVVGLWADRNPMVYSKLTRQNIQVPDENSQGEELIDCLVDLGRSARSRRVLYMMSDLGAFLASTHREQLEPYYIYPWMTWDQVKATLHRKTMFEIAASAGVALPKTWFSNNDNWSDVNLEKLPYPLILKPMVSRFGFEDEKVTNAWTFTNKYGKAIELHDAAQFRAVLPDLLSDDTPVCAQERIHCKISDLWTHHFYSVGGEIKAQFCGHKVHQIPEDFGTGSITRAEPNLDIARESAKFLRATQFTGIGNIEYIRTDDGYKFVEINPRGYYWSSLATACGVNLYKIMYDHLGLGIEPEWTQQTHDGLIWYDVDHLPSYLRSPNKEMSVSRFLLSRRMEAAANLREPRLAYRRYKTFWKNLMSVKPA